jgi:hypothetical protein
MNAWELARAQHVIDALFAGLDVPVEHRHVRAHPHAVRRPVDVEIPRGAALVVGDLPAHTLGEDFGASAGKRIEARFPQLDEHLLVGLRVKVGEEGDLDRGEALEMNVGADPFEAPEQLRVVVERQIRVQAVDDVDLGQRLITPAPKLLPRLFQ